MPTPPWAKSKFPPPTSELDKYSGHMKIKIVEHFAQGGCVATFCDLVGISRPAFNYWRRKYQEFGQAFERAKVAYEAWYHNNGKDNQLEYKDTGAKFNFNIWKELGK